MVQTLVVTLTLWSWYRKVHIIATHYTITRFNQVQFNSRNTSNRTNAFKDSNDNSANNATVCYKQNVKI